MTNKKNKSFVQINPNKKITEDVLIDPMKQYEYIEDPKKKINSNIIFCLIAVIIIIAIVIILVFLHGNKEDLNQNNNPTTQKLNNEVITTTTTTIPNTTTTSSITNIYRELICSSEVTNNNLQSNEIILLKFSNNKLHTSISSFTIKLLDESVKEEYENQIFLLNLTTSALISNDNYEVTNSQTDTEYTLNISVEYNENFPGNGVFTYDKEYSSLKTELESLGYTCK